MHALRTARRAGRLHKPKQTKINSMKRRKFLTAVGGAAGAAALGGCCSTKEKSSTPKTRAVSGKKKREQVTTYGLSSISSADPNSPFTMDVRLPGWFPDGVDVKGSPKRLFLEEVAGIKQNNVVESFPVEFDYTGKSKNWILGYPLSTSQTSLTKLVQKLAVRLRQYNASLYRLRRLHYYWYYKDHDSRFVAFPKPNPYGDPRDANHNIITPQPKTDRSGFNDLAKAAERDWDTVCGQVNDLLETATTANNIFGVQLMAADMIAANGYIVSVRVVVKKPNWPPNSPPHPEPGGSSSHVSISSAFSSSSQKVT